MLFQVSYIFSVRSNKYQLIWGDEAPGGCFWRTRSEAKRAHNIDITGLANPTN